MIGRDRTALAAALGLSVVLMACTPRPETPDPADILAARQAALSYDVRLRTEVLGRLDRGEDPVAVYLAYRDKAPDFARETAERFGMDFARVSPSPRNPANTADPWEADQIEQFEFWRQAGIDPTVMEISAIVGEDGEKAFRWIRPIVMTETCMACHGEDEVDSRVALLIAQEYALDEAHGYFETEIAGAYSVRKAK